MPTVIDNRNSLEQTIRVFDSFYSVDLQVGATQYDIVHGYFKSVCETRLIADNFTVTLFRIAQQTGIDVLILLDELKGKGTSTLQMNKIMSYYLNGLKSKTSLYGVSVIPRPNVPTARNIVQ